MIEPVRVLPWDLLGTPMQQTSAELALKESGLAGWNVQKKPLYADAGGLWEQSLITIPGKMATLRTDTFEVLGVVGEKYEVVQNEEAFDVLTLIVDESSSAISSAGSAGSKVFMSIKMPDTIMVAGEDAHDLYLNAMTSHDGTSAFHIAVTPVRQFCTNQQTMILKEAKQKWSLRHTSSVQGKIMEARTSLALTFKYVEEFEKQMERLLMQSVSDAEWEALVADLVPESTSPAAGWQKRVSDRREALSGLFYDSPSQAFGRGTKYAAYNAITEYADWVMPLRGADPGGYRRAERALTMPTVENFKVKGLALL